MTKKKVLVVASAVLVGLLSFWLGYLPSRLPHPIRRPLTATPESVGLQYENVAFPARGGDLTVRAWWMPSPKARGVLIYIHGASTNRQTPFGLEISKFFEEQGLSVLAPDLRNHGQSDGTPTGRLTMGADEAKDVLGAVEWAAARAPGLPIDLMGASMGGAAAIYAAAADPRVKRLVLLDPVLNPHETAVNLVQAVLRAPRWAVVPMVWSVETFFPMDTAHHDPLKTAETLSQPVLLVQDDRDRVCPPRYAQLLAEQNHAVTLWVSHDPGNGVNHGVAFQLHRDEVEQQMAAFLAGPLPH
jgi:alpha-beta hydrolase superfamily lysophospholipase